jgi:PEP-CTERM motif
LKDLLARFFLQQLFMLVEYYSNTQSSNKKKGNEMKRFATLFSVILTAFASPGTARADIILTDPTESYLFANFGSPPPNAVPIALSSLSFAPTAGQYITIAAYGTYDPFGGGHNTYTLSSGVFSSTSTLLPPNVLNRVPGALSTNAPQHVTQPVEGTGSSTDIPQDFLISDSPSGQTSITVQIPIGANYLFANVDDSYYPDNTAPTGFGFNITPASVPEPSSFILLGVVGAFGFIAYRGRRRASVPA